MRMLYQPDPSINPDLKVRQQEADQRFAPHRDAEVIWRNGIGLPQGYVDALPMKVEP